MKRRLWVWCCAVLSFIWAVGSPSLLAMESSVAPSPWPSHEFSPVIQPTSPLASPLDLSSWLQPKLPELVNPMLATRPPQKQASQPLPFASRSPLKSAQRLNETATQQFAQGQTEQAILTWQQAQSLYGQAQDIRGVLGTQINQAQALQTMGLYRRARSLMDEVEDQLAAQPDSEVTALGYQSLGSILQATGYLDESEAALQKSLEISQRHGLESSATWIALGNTRRAQKNFDGAEQAYGSAIATAQESQVHLEAQLNQFSLRLQQQQKAQAKQLLPKIEQDLRSVKPSRRSVYARVNFAASLMQAGQAMAAPKRVAEILTTAATQAKTMRDARAESYALGELGSLYEKTGQWQDAKGLTHKALNLAQTSHAPDIAYRWQWQMGRLAVASHGGEQRGLTEAQRQTAIAAYQDAATTLRSIRGDLVATNSEIQFSFQESVEPLYRQMVSLMIQPNSSSEILLAARNAIEELQIAELENFFRSACLDVTPEKDIDSVDPTAAVIYPILLPDRLEVLLSIAGEPMTHHTVYQPQSEIEAIIDQWLINLSPVASNRKQKALAGQLYDWLIRPIQGQLQEKAIQTLVFVPDGSLRNLPMAALHDGDQYLIEDYQVALTPGLQLLEPQALSSEKLAALSVGLTQARQGFAALPGVQEEIEQIQANVPSKVVLDQEFTTDNLRGQLADTAYPIVHLATHGQFSSDPEQTFLLTWDDEIKVRDIRTLLKSRSSRRSNPIELLVLSACQTATGDRQAALGLAGLAVQSGARSTLATLWSVNDSSTALLMTELYQQLSQSGQVSRGQSLRKAQLALIQNEQYNHPFYWSPFVLVGNWL